MGYEFYIEWWKNAAAVAWEAARRGDLGVLALIALAASPLLIAAGVFRIVRGHQRIEASLARLDRMLERSGPPDRR